MSPFEVQLLGTNSALPAFGRHPPSQILSIQHFLVAIAVSVNIGGLASKMISARLGISVPNESRHSVSMIYVMDLFAQHSLQLPLQHPFSRASQLLQMTLRMLRRQPRHQN